MVPARLYASQVTVRVNAINTATSSQWLWPILSVLTSGDMQLNWLSYKDKFARIKLTLHKQLSQDHILTETSFVVTELKAKLLKPNSDAKFNKGALLLLQRC